MGIITKIGIFHKSKNAILNTLLRMILNNIKITGLSNFKSIVIEKQIAVD